MKHSEILKLARPLIESGVERFVCAAAEWPVSELNCAKLKKEISKRLGKYWVVEGWLYLYAGIPSELLTKENMRIYRLRWIDSMIAEFEAKGELIMELNIEQERQELGAIAEEYLREKYGAYRGHYEWRALQEAFIAGLHAKQAALDKAAIEAQEEAQAEQMADRAWNKFNAAISDGPDSPYPGMAQAFEACYSQKWPDPEWRQETATWAAAWKCAHPAIVQKGEQVTPATDTASADAEPDAINARRYAQLRKHAGLIGSRLWRYAPWAQESFEENQARLDLCLDEEFLALQQTQRGHNE